MYARVCSVRLFGSLHPAVKKPRNSTILRQGALYKDCKKLDSSPADGLGTQWKCRIAQYEVDNQVEDLENHAEVFLIIREPDMLPLALLSVNNSFGALWTLKEASNCKESLSLPSCRKSFSVGEKVRYLIVAYEIAAQEVPRKVNYPIRRAKSLSTTCMANTE